MRNCGNYNQNHFSFAWDSYILFHTGNLQVPLEKNQSLLKYQFPPKILIWPKSVLYKHFEKWLSPSLSHPLTRHHPVSGRGCKLWYYTYLFLYHNTQSWFYMFYYSFYSIKELCCKSKAESLQMQKQKTFHLNPHMSYQLKCHTNTSHS